MPGENRSSSVASAVLRRGAHRVEPLRVDVQDPVGLPSISSRTVPRPPSTM